MSVRVTGMGKLAKDIDDKLGKFATQKAVDQALMAGAEVFMKELKMEFEKFKDTGQSIEEMEAAPPKFVGGVRTVLIRWRGPLDRYKLIHLNEFGTVQHPNPRGKGAVARAMQNSQKAYRKALNDALRRYL